MKILHAAILLFLALIPFVIFGQSSEGTVNDQNLTSLMISFDGFLEDKNAGILLKGDFQIIKKNNIYFGVSSNNLYCGTDKVPRWRTQLSNTMISKIRAFITELEQTPHDVNIAGFQNDIYIAKFKEKEWRIHPNQSIFNSFKANPESPNELPDLSFYKSIFSEQIKDFTLDSEKHVATTNKLIKRKWYYDPSSLLSLTKGSTIHLHSSPSQRNSEYWEVENDFGFKRSTSLSADSNSRVSIEYHRQETISSHMYFSIYASHLLERADDEEWAFQRTSFYILELNEKELILKIAY